MALDGITTHFLARELHSQLAGGRIDKVYQPSRYDLYILIRNDSQNYRVLFSADPAGPRVHVTDSLRENPILPPSFCMLLRKHLQGARILEITNPSFERIIEMTVQTTDEIGDRKDKRLIIEMMGRYSNVILVNSENRIFDSLLHVDSQMSRVREIMPARIYAYPPAQGKMDPAAAYSLLIDNKLPLLPEAYGRPLEKALQDSLLGFSPELCRELCYLSGIDARKGVRQFSDADTKALLSVATPFIKRILESDIKPAAYASAKGATLTTFHCLPLRDSGHPVYFPTISHAMDAVYRAKDSIIDFEQKKRELMSFMKSALDHALRRQNIHRADLDLCRDMEQDQLWGALLLQNAYQIPAGADSFAAIDYSKDPYETVEIPLDPSKSVAQNAQIFFRRYAKCKSKRASAEIFLAEDDQAVEYLMSLAQAVDIAAEPEDLNALREEMKQSGLMSFGKQNSSGKIDVNKTTSAHPGKAKSGSSGSRAIRAAAKAASLRQSKSKKENKHSGDSPAVGFRRYQTTDGFVILCGRNNLQNDQLTLKTASPDDLWFHVQKMPGTHVILRSPDGSNTHFPENAILQAAQTAAFFSRTTARLEKSRASDPRHSKTPHNEDINLKIPVDYCPVKNVKKPPKMKPGMVIYDQYRTIYVSPVDPSKSL
jgi:predicted ribosome quality control (RQC) complex YloA/Tae2 family protein